MKIYKAVIGFLEDRIFPAVVAYATHPFIISLTILLLIPLIVFASITSLVLILGNYTNVVSAAVSSIVLLQQISQHTEIKQLHKDHATQLATVRADHAADIAALHESHKALHAKLDTLIQAKGPPSPADTPPIVLAKRAHRKKVAP